MARLVLLPLLLLTLRGGGGGLAVRLSGAQAFAPSLRRDGSISNVQHEIASRPRRPTRRRDPPLRMDPSGNEPATASVTKNILPFTAVASLSLATIAAYTQLLPGPLIDATSPPPFFGTLPFGVVFSGSCGPYTPSLIVRDLLSSMACIGGAAIFVKAITQPASEGRIDSRDARKIIHTLSAPLFVLLWPLFSNAYGARVFASIVPLLNAVRLVVAGTGGDAKEGAGEQFASESELAGAISRSGDAKEALGGPFIYVLVMLFSTLFLWTDSPIGVVSLATMAIGDGLADLIGRRFGSTNKWPFNPSKSMAGSAAFVAGSFVGSFGLISWLTSVGTMDPLDLGTVGLAGRLLAIAVISAGVELIPVGDDNWSVPLSAAVLSAILLN